MHLNKIRRNIRIHLFKPGIIFDPKGGKPHIHGDLFHCTCHVCVINRTWVKWKQSKYVLYWSTNTFIIFSFLGKKSVQCILVGSGISRRGYKALHFVGSFTAVCGTRPLWSHSSGASKMDAFTCVLLPLLSMALKSRGCLCEMGRLPATLNVLPPTIAMPLAMICLVIS